MKGNTLSEKGFVEGSLDNKYSHFPGNVLFRTFL